MLLSNFPDGAGVGVEDGRNKDVPLSKGCGADDSEESGEKEEERGHERGRHHRERG